MKIVCPNCSSDYTLADDLLGPKGRKVKCASCAQVWQVAPNAPAKPVTKEPVAKELVADKVVATKAATGQAPTAQANPKTQADPADSAHSADSADPAGDGGDLSAWGTDSPDDDQDDALEEGSLPSGPVDAGAGTMARRAPGVVRLKGHRGRPSPLHRWVRQAKIIAPPVAVALGLVGLVLAIPMRDAVVRVLPDLAALYEMVGLDVNVRGIAFSPFTAERTVVAGLTLLRIEGRITNVDDRIRSVAPLRLSLVSDNGAELFVWRMDPPTTDLMPEQSVPVFSELTAPPETVARVSVRFLQDGERLPGEIF